MKLFVISDLHLSLCGEKPMEVFGTGWENHWEKIKADWDARVAEEDIVLIAGDISWAMYLKDALVDLNAIAKRKGIKIFIRGNHDYWWSSLKKIRDALPPNMYVIQNDALKMGRYVFAGSRGWTSPETGEKQGEEDAKLYARETLRLEMALQNAAKIREEGDVLVGMMHYPPFNARFEDSNFTRLFRQYDADAVVYGHLHGAACRTKERVLVGGVPYYLTSCDKLDFRLKELVVPEDASLF